MMLELLKVFLISMIPVAECRVAIPLGVNTYGLPIWQVLTAAIAGNIFPVPFLILFGRKVLHWLARFEKPGRPFRWIIRHGEKKAAALTGALFFGLLMFVAIPLPGTGAWTGALVAITMQLRMRESLPAISLGVIIAALIMTFGSTVFSVLT